jgi:hypothetical protein
VRDCSPTVSWIAASWLDICGRISAQRSCFVVCRASYCEIYNEGLHDLIRYNNRAQLAVRWDPGHGFHVPELAKVPAPALQDMYKVCMHLAACMHRMQVLRMQSVKCCALPR